MFLGQGIYPDISEDVYHGDPCPEPSLNQSTAKILLERSPRHAWHQHPRLNPSFQRDNEKKFDAGNIAHGLLLGRGRKLQVLDFGDWRTKESQKLRDAVFAAGGQPVLTKQYQSAIEMRDAALRQLRSCGIEWLPETHPEAMSEVALIWEDNAWLRTKIDRLQRGVSIDYKTTAGEATEHALQTRMITDGWHIQAAMHEWGLNTLMPDMAGRHRFLFVVQETYAPYALVAWELPESAMTMGREQLAKAADMWRGCMRSKRWPSYNNEQVGRLEVPAWALSQWQQRLGVRDAAE